MKITLATITFNTDYVLNEFLESWFPHVDKIILVDNPVKYWQDKGFKSSTDYTHTIVNAFIERHNLHNREDKFKFIFSSNPAAEKTDACRLFMPFVPSDTDYLFVFDSDELFHDRDIRKLKEMLEKHKPDVVKFKSNTFYGGLDYVMRGFERRHDFKRVLRYEKGCTYANHRPPTLSVKETKIIGGQWLYENYGIEMYHYSYVSPKQVKDKIKYYESSVIKRGDCIPNYFEEVWLRWVTGSDRDRQEIEEKWNGVHEFMPNVRGEAKTELCRLGHPSVITENKDKLVRNFNQQLDYALTHLDE